MKIIAAIAFIFALAQASYAQTANANSNSSSGSIAASQSGVVLNQNTPGTQRIVTVQDGTATSELRNVPAITAPSILGGGHPCLSGQSGGIAVAGFGGSFGAGDAEVVCMLMFAGQHEAAIRALVMTDPVACKALAHVGYYVIPMGNGKSKAVPFTCDKKVKKGGVYSRNVGGPNVASATVSSKNRVPNTAPKLYSKCALEGNQIKIKYTAAGRKNKQVAAQACQRQLDY